MPFVKLKVIIERAPLIHLNNVSFSDKKPTNFTRLQSFATRLGFDPSEIATMNFNFDFKKTDLDGIASITDALEELLKFPSFTIDQSAKIFSVVNHLIECVGEINVNETRLKPLTNR